METRFEKRSAEDNYEIRNVKAEVRTSESGNTIVGTIPFNVLSQDFGDFRERIMPSAFRMTMNSDAEVWSYFQHDSDKVMARRSTGTLGLTLTEDELQIEISPSNTTWSRDALEVIRHGDSDGFSFGFWLIEDRWIKEDDQIVRELISVDLGEVSVVYNPVLQLPSSDFVITDSDGIVCDQEIRDQDDDFYWVFFKVSLSSTSDNQFYVYFGGE
ncbi:HK97 family phage prohead protease [Rubinisphaera sp.]|uniref:HK97 family phage prohead protease n=1 Tax=Rubinisphaera sp. TaxID=2024857 RepID=UPI000C0D4570|nr:HK97 family phage prohead protease [Rubinisphaera sp.]MBV12400.1 HK97 family phage prohead protease [Rubinisphaera sp.]HCS50101.1 HK97 family phage prohead protease [Planctomycetaceae bacterium]|tara:strand:+ start:214 stop:855 length:642 start_codon:yes stop_codon:yes gene_type:complete